MLLEEPWNVPVWTRQLNGLLETNDVGKIREYYRLLVTAFPTSVLLINYTLFRRLFLESHLV